MPSLLSLHVAMTKADRKRYPRGIDFRLFSSGHDASDMAAIAKHFGVREPGIVKNPTVARLKSCFRKLAKEAQQGDTVFFTYSGHGGWVPDVDSIIPELPIPSEVRGGSDVHPTIVLYDRMFLEDEWQLIWKSFEPGVVVVTMFDSCHAGSAPISFDSHLLDFVQLKSNVGDLHSKQLGKDPAERIYRARKKFYDRLQARKIVFPLVRLIHFAACDNTQAAQEYREGQGSLFTLAVHRLIMSRRPPRTYADLHARLSKLFKRSSQTPTLMTWGAATSNDLDNTIFPVSRGVL